MPPKVFHLKIQVTVSWWPVPVASVEPLGALLVLCLSPGQGGPSGEAAGPGVAAPQKSCALGGPGWSSWWVRVMDFRVKWRGQVGVEADWKEGGRCLPQQRSFWTWRKVLSSLAHDWVSVAGSSLWTLSFYGFLWFEGLCCLICRNPS